MGSGGDTLKVGSVLGDHYELMQVVANGGMAQVWVANDQQADESVAVKVLHPHLAQDEKFKARFVREAQAAKKLDHPAIVSIKDDLDIGDTHVIIMDYIDGISLRDHLDKVGTVSVDEVIKLGSELANGIAVAHDEGIVHRDIKPANIMLQENSTSVLTDFGIAKTIADSDLTATGMLLGTAKYLSPEQVTGDVTDGRSDLYSLAVVMYEALAGIAPFVADNEAATALLRLQKPAPALSGVAPELREDRLDEFFAKALHKKPDNRYQTAEEFADALAEIDANEVLNAETISDAKIETKQLNYHSAIDDSERSIAPNGSPAWLLFGGSIFLIALIFAIIGLLGALADLNTDEVDLAKSEHVVLLQDGTYLADTEAYRSLDEDTETAWVVEDDTITALAIELTESRTVDNIAVLASDAEASFDIGLYEEGSTIDSPDQTVTAQANISSEVTSATYKFIVVSFDVGEVQEPLAIREIYIS